MELHVWLRRLRACKETVAWAKTYGDNYQRAWAECPNGAWMLWILALTSNSEPWSEGRRKLVAACLGCVLLAHRWPSWETPHMLEAAEPLRLWALEDDQNAKQVAMSRRHLFSAAAHPWVTNAVDAAYAVAYTADARGVAYAALCAGLADDDSAAQRCADVVRIHFREAHPPEATNLQGR